MFILSHTRRVCVRVCTFIGAHSHVSLHGWLSATAVIETCFRCWFQPFVLVCDRPSHSNRVVGCARIYVCVSVCLVTTSHLCPPYLCQHRDWTGSSKPASSSSSAEAQQEAPPSSWTGFLLHHQHPSPPLTPLSRNAPSYHTGWWDWNYCGGK